jgi:hypothetical protein
MDWMGEIPNGSCTVLEILLKHSEHTLFLMFFGNGNSVAGMFVVEWWALIVFSPLTYCTGACFLIHGTRKAFYTIQVQL